jgi:hypothetical protein
MDAISEARHAPRHGELQIVLMAERDAVQRLQ